MKHLVCRIRGHRWPLGVAFIGSGICIQHCRRCDALRLITPPVKTGSNTTAASYGTTVSYGTTHSY